MSGSIRLRPGLAVFAIGLLSVGAACTTFSGVGDLGQGGADQGGGGTPGGNGGANAAGNTGAGTGPTTGSSTSGGGNGASASATATSSTAASSTAASSTAASSTAASSSAAASSSSSGTVNDPAQICVDTINQYRATMGLAPYARWTAEETCGGTEAMKDYQTMTAHSAFGQCTENAQNECPNWPGPEGTMIPKCLAMMWAEGPGPFNQGHGHYINMSSTTYTKVACGFYTTPQGTIWAVQDFK